MAGSGDDFRDGIAALLRAAGHDIQTEVLLGGKKVDVVVRRRGFLRTETAALEAKDYETNVPLDEVMAFVHAYGSITRAGWQTPRFSSQEVTSLHRANRRSMQRA